MATIAKSFSPARLLLKEINCKALKAFLATKDDMLADAVMMPWILSVQLRAREGRQQLSNTSVSHAAGVRLQAVADVLTGVVRRDTRTPGRICSVLKSIFIVIDQD